MVGLRFASLKPYVPRGVMCREHPLSPRMYPQTAERARIGQNCSNTVAERFSRAGDGECAQMNATAMVAHARPQYMRALQRANEVRLARAELKRAVAAGEIEVAEVILEC